MKRLVKTSSINYDNFLISHLNYNLSSTSDVDNIINENADCVYNGEAYRTLYFYEEDIKEAYDELLRSENEDKMTGNNIGFYAYNVMDKLIRSSSSYQSFSKTLNGTQNFAKFMQDTDSESYIYITYSCNVQNGLDINKLIEKYKDNLSNETLDAYNDFKNQEEILAKVDGLGDYTISGLSLDTLHTLFNRFDKHK